ncbi:MAG: hypothetical protein ABIQ99_17640 [Thermoflexales bacterium]
MRFSPFQDDGRSHGRLADLLQALGQPDVVRVLLEGARGGFGIETFERRNIGGKRL